MKYKIINIVACFFLSLFVCILGYLAVSDQLEYLKSLPHAVQASGITNLEDNSSRNSSSDSAETIQTKDPHKPIGADLYQHIPHMSYVEEQGWVYEIQQGDTLTHVSELTGVGVDELANFNGVRNNHEIIESAYLRIPVLNQK